MRTVSVWSGKGGSGKTTTALNLAAALAERGEPVLLLDLDGQASLSRALGVAPRDGLLDAIRATADLTPLVQPTPLEGVSLVPAGVELDRAERILAGEVGADRLLGETLEVMPERGGWLVVDCAPGVSVLAVSALAATQLHLAPIDARPISAATLGDTLDLADAVRKRLNPQLESRILITRTTRTRASSGITEAIRDRFADMVLRVEIPERAAVVEASAQRLSVLDVDSDNAASVAFRGLAAELLEGEGGSDV